MQNSNKPMLHPELKPIAYRSRKRQVIPNNSRNWHRNRYWYMIAFEEQCNPADVRVDESILDTRTEEEKMAHMRQMLAARL